jgi:hypothetical protein
MQAELLNSPIRNASTEMRSASEFQNTAYLWDSEVVPIHDRAAAAPQLSAAGYLLFWGIAGDLLPVF